MSEKTDKIKKVLETYRAQLCKYKKAFMEDGTIDKGEQEQLDKLEALISQCEQKLVILKPNVEKEIDFGIKKQGYDPSKPSVFNPIGLDPKFMPKMEMWPMDVNAYLDDNRGLLGLNMVKDTIKKMRAKVTSIKDLTDNSLDAYIREWAQANNVIFQFDKKALTGTVEAAMERFFSEFKKFGHLDWKFSGASLNINLLGQSATFGYKNKKMEMEISGSKDSVSGKLGGKITEDVEAKVEGKHEFEDKSEAKVTVKTDEVEASVSGNVDKDGEGSLSTEVKTEHVDLEGTINSDKSGGGKLTIKKDKTEVSVGAEVDAEGKVSASASIKLKDVINFKGSSGSVSMSLKGDESSWSFNLEIGTSGGKQAHLSRSAAEEIKKALLKGAESLNEIYKIMGEVKESGANPKDIAAKIAPYWADVEKALKKLDKDVKKPSNQSELFLSFGVGGSEETGMAATAGLTFRF